MPDIELLSVRSEMLRLTSQILEGPFETNEILASPPMDTYLTGILWPEEQMLEVDLAGNDDEERSAGSQDDQIDAGVPGYRAIRPCSIGLTFAADANASVTISLGTTARYLAVEVEAPDNPKGRRREWRRVVLGYRVNLEPGEARTWSVHEFVDQSDAILEDRTVRIHIRRRIRDGVQILTITLINTAVDVDGSRRDELSLFQAMLEINAVSADQTPAILPRASLSLDENDEDRRSAALLYRNIKEYAVGHGIAVMWEDETNFRVSNLKTSWMPSAALKNMSPVGHSMLEDYLKSNPDTLRAEWLATGGERKQVIAALIGFAQCYASWIEALEADLGSFVGQLHKAAELNLENCRKAFDRIKAGIDTLADSEDAWLAFNLANSAMDRQSRFDAKKPNQRPLVWRPFQLAYILMVLPGIVDPQDEYREDMDLLWFPTGGGKTEAYLGLTAFQIFYRRLGSKERRVAGGTDVIMRYTLRLLTVQQFQRAASLICACDHIRQERGDLGTAAISIGLYVGGDATPNRSKDAFDALRQEFDGRQPRSTPRQLLNCPVCGHDLPVSAYSIAQGETGIDIRCGNADCLTEGQPLPVLTVDDFLYVYPPSLLIGTIDKFAQLPRRQNLRTLFGLDGELRPGLIIQDELHLISGPLGSIAGLYETVIDMLCTKDGIRPKVIGSTATIGQAARQVRALFDRPVLQFPPAGFDASDSFFAVRKDDDPDRVYVGLSSAGRSPKFALQAAAAALLQSAGHLKQADVSGKDLDPYWTAVLYFNSLRELGGAHVLVQDDIPRQMEFLSGRFDGDKTRKLEADVIELSGRVSSRDLPDYLKALGDSIPDAQDPFAAQPPDVVLASNMISVGVDVPRLGLMLVNGQPKSTAEYIQASSRVGRGIDGLVLTLYNFGRPRDVSHFEHFLSYHSAIYRSVEATSVTPWAPRARDKALHAVIASAVRHMVDGMADDDAALKFDGADPQVLEIIHRIAMRSSSASHGIEGEDTEVDLESIVKEWSQRSADSRAAGKDLLYWERRAPFGKTKPHLMTSAEEGAKPGKLAWPTPNSMREVEPSTSFTLKHMRRVN